MPFWNPDVLKFFHEIGDRAVREPFEHIFTDTDLVTTLVIARGTYGRGSKRGIPVLLYRNEKLNSFNVYKINNLPAKENLLIDHLRIEGLQFNIVEGKTNKTIYLRTPITFKLFWRILNHFTAVNP